ncbi:MAG: hypothetical protein ACK4NV_19050 [Pannonibacter sp.]|jgi:hypothetical protein
MSNVPLINPLSGQISFGRVPEIKSRSLYVPAGHIHLRKGRHIGPNQGFGALHIWAEHSKEMRQRNFCAVEDVPAYVASIIRVGTPLHFPGGNLRRTRIIAVQASTGMAILEQQSYLGDTVWSVVTAYSGKRKDGPRIGAVS